MSRTSLLKHGVQGRPGQPGRPPQDGLHFETRVDGSHPEVVRRLCGSTGNFSPEEVDLAEELVQENLRLGPASGYRFIWARQDGPTLGYACFGPIPCTLGSFDLYWIAVDRAHQGAGIGQRLMALVEEMVAAGGGRRVYVDTSSRPDYQPTRFFYQRQGYTCEAVISDFYAAGEDKVIFKKTLG